MKKCPFCQSEIPDETKFCLHCFSAVDKFDDEAVVTPKTKSKAKSKLKLMVKPKSNKVKSRQVVSLVSAIVLLTVTAFCILAVKKIPNSIPTDSEVPTILQPVTKENGEQVTQEDGEPVFEVVTVESTTGKKNIISVLFGKDKDKDKNKNNSAESEESTTEKQGIFDKLFGKDEDGDKNKDDESSTDNIASDEPTATVPVDSSTEDDSTDQSSTTASTTATTTATTAAPTTTEKLTYKIEDFEYEVRYDGNICIVKYTGNDSTVVVPAYIDGKPVVEIGKFGEYAIADNPSIQKVICLYSKMLDLKINSYSFNNLPNLKEVVLPPNTFFSTPQYRYLFTECPNLESVTFNPSTNYLVVDGAVYNSSGTILYFYPPGRRNTSFTMLDTCQIMWDAFYENKYLKTIILGKSLNEVYRLQWAFFGCTSLTNIYVDSSNKSDNVYSIDGVLYCKESDEDHYTVIYPGGRKSTSYIFPATPDGKYLYFIEQSFSNNPYIKEFKVPMYTRFNDGYYKNKKFGAPNLNKIYLKDCDDSYNVYRETFKSRYDIDIAFY